MELMGLRDDMMEMWSQLGSLLEEQAVRVDNGIGDVSNGNSASVGGSQEEKVVDGLGREIGVVIDTETIRAKHNVTIDALATSFGIM